ncbi:MAG: prepilin-type N-terminal cleavage/methylation domain-containing protein [Terriglobales bacterium]
MKKHKAKKHANKKNKGFSLIELLIVVAIILIIAAIAIPNLLRSRIAANEASAVGSIRTLNTAEVTYNTTYPTVGFTGLTALGPVASGGTASSTAAGLIDANLASGTKSGYSFTVTPATSVPSTDYQSAAAPVTLGTTGQRYFCSDSSGVIQYNATGSTGATCAGGTNTPI